MGKEEGSEGVDRGWRRDITIPVEILLKLFIKTNGAEGRSRMEALNHVTHGFEKRRTTTLNFSFKLM